jgi:hypothetical protein
MVARVLLPALALGASALFYVACTDIVSHAYRGATYNSARDCLEGELAIDIVEGVDPGTGCAAICLEGTSLASTPDSGISVYVTTNCPPVPRGLSESDSAACKAALAAKARKDVCGADGKSANPKQDAGASALDGSPGDGGPG